MGLGFLRKGGSGLGSCITPLTFPEQERSQAPQGHWSTALGAETPGYSGKVADWVAGAFPGISPCPVFCTLNRRHIKHLLDGWVSRVQVSGVLWAGGWQQGPLVREVETSNCLPQGFWDRILGRTVRPSGPSSLLSSIFWLLSPSSGLQWQSKGSL